MHVVCGSRGISAKRGVACCATTAGTTPPLRLPIVGFVAEMGRSGAAPLQRKNYHAGLYFRTGGFVAKKVIVRAELFAKQYQCPIFGREWDLYNRK